MQMGACCMQNLTEEQLLAAFKKKYHRHVTAALSQLPDSLRAKIKKTIDDIFTRDVDMDKLKKHL